MHHLHLQISPKSRNRHLLRGQAQRRPSWRSQAQRRPSWHVFKVFFFFLASDEGEYPKSRVHYELCTPQGAVQLRGDSICLARLIFELIDQPISIDKLRPFISRCTCIEPYLSSNRSIYCVDSLVFFPSKIKIYFCPCNAP